MSDVELNISCGEDGFVHVVSLPKFTLSVEGTHVIEEEAALVRRHVAEVNVWGYLFHGLWEDASTIIKPCSCVGFLEVARCMFPEFL